MSVELPAVRDACGIRDARHASTPRIPHALRHRGSNLPCGVLHPGYRWLLNCMSNQNLPGIHPFMRYLTLSEIREALGPDFRLEAR